MSDGFHFQQVGYSRFYIDQRYTNLKPAGDGSYGFVVSGVDSVTGQKVAIKKVTNVFNDVIDAKRILRELKLLRHFNSHENIISILDIMTVPPNTPDFTDIYIVTNLMESDLDRIIRSKQRLTDQHFQYFLYQILRALKYVHSANVLHRDLKPSNLLVNANCDLAICDFGLSRGFDVEGEDTMTEYVVTRWYRSPELLCLSPHYGRAVDIWSVGCIFAELLTHSIFFCGQTPNHQLEVIVSKIGCPPVERLDFVQVPAAIQALQQQQIKLERTRPYLLTPEGFASLFPPDCNPLALDLLRSMLSFHPDDRITVEQALAHPYLKDFHGQLPEPNCRDLFDFDFEHDFGEMTKPVVQYLIYEEMRHFRPRSPQYPRPPMIDPSSSTSSSSSSSYPPNRIPNHTNNNRSSNNNHNNSSNRGSEMEMDVATPVWGSERSTSEQQQRGGGGGEYRGAHRRDEKEDEEDVMLTAREERDEHFPHASYRSESKQNHSSSSSSYDDDYKQQQPSQSQYHRK